MALGMILIFNFLAVAFAPCSQHSSTFRIMSSSERRSVFKPCIDLHDGQVKQIVGGTLTDTNETLKTNFVAK